MNSSLGGVRPRQRMHPASPAKWKWTQIIFMSARILKSIPNFLDKFLFFFFFSCCLLRVMMYSLLQVAVEIKSLPSAWCKYTRPIHSHPGENAPYFTVLPGVNTPGFSTSFVPLFSLFSLLERDLIYFPASLLLSGNG